MLQIQSQRNHALLTSNEEILKEWTSYKVPSTPKGGDGGTNASINSAKELKEPQKEQKDKIEKFANLLDMDLQVFAKESDEVIFVCQIDKEIIPPVVPIRSPINRKKRVREAGAEILNITTKRAKSNEESASPAGNGVREENTKWKPLMTYPKNRSLPKPIKIENNFNLLTGLQKAFKLPFYDKYHLWNHPNQLFNEMLLPYDSWEYEMISNMFSSARIYEYEIAHIFKIENPFILLHYHIAKSKFLTQNDGLKENFYFHGTWDENVTSICQFNFDRSKVINHKFGKGISFANDSLYATNYPKGCERFNKIMVVAKAFYKNPVETGFNHTIVPEGPSYTTKNQAGTVMVKYDDASYYPAYVIIYNRNYYF